MTLIRHRMVATRGLAPLALCAAAALPPFHAARAQAGRPAWVFSGGTFLTRDRGWNYDLGLELAAAREWPLAARLRLDAGATLFTAPGTLGQGREAIYPPYPEGLRHAAALRLQARTHTAGPGLYLLGGVEALAGSAGVSGSGVRAGGSVGLGLTWRRAARSALEGRYVAFDRPLGTSRGVLTVRYVRRR